MYPYPTQDSNANMSVPQDTDCNFLPYLAQTGSNCLQPQDTALNNE